MIIDASVVFRDALIQIQIKICKSEINYLRDRVSLFFHRRKTNRYVKDEGSYLKFFGLKSPLSEWTSCWISISRFRFTFTHVDTFFILTIFRGRPWATTSHNLSTSFIANSQLSWFDMKERIRRLGMLRPPPHWSLNCHPINDTLRSAWHLVPPAG